MQQMPDINHGPRSVVGAKNTGTNRTKSPLCGNRKGERATKQVNKQTKMFLIVKGAGRDWQRGGAMEERKVLSEEVTFGQTVKRSSLHTVLRCRDGDVRVVGVCLKTRGKDGPCSQHCQ